MIGHEYFHNWTGNRVTCRDWFQLSLKEGLTVFRDQEFSADMGSRAVERIAAVDYLREHQFPEDAGPMAHPVRPDEYVEINNFYTATVYEKGAEVIRMQHTLLGPERFRRGMDLYFERHDGQAVTCDDFVQAMEDASVGPAGPISRSSAAGTRRPARRSCARRGRYDAARAHLHARARAADRRRRPDSPTRRRSTFRSRSAWSAPTAAICRCGSPASARRTARRACCRSRPKRRRSCSSTSGRAGAVAAARLLGAGAARVRLHATRELAFLAAHDSDPVQPLGRRAAQLLRRDPRARGRTRARRAAGAAAAARGRLPRSCVADDRADPALLALALTPPEPAYLAGLVDTIDVDALVGGARVRRARARARAAAPRSSATHALHRPRAAYAPTQEQIGPRMLRNVCLRYLGAIDDAPARALAVAQYDAADNMTDAIAALAAVNHSGTPEREALFARFEAKWRDEPLVLDKWFALQATSLRADTLARVRALLAHPRFNARNPNRVRALVATFALPQLARVPRAPTAPATRSSPSRCSRSTAVNPQLAAALARRVQPVAAIRRAAPRAAAGRARSDRRARRSSRRTSRRSSSAISPMTPLRPIWHRVRRANRGRRGCAPGSGAVRVTLGVGPCAQPDAHQ